MMTITTAAARPVSQRSAGREPFREADVMTRCLRLRRALVRRTVIVWSSVIATRSRKPQIAWSQNGEMPSTYSAELIVESSSAPSAAPMTLPLPPKIATPPTTTAAYGWSSKPVPAVESIVPYWAAHSTPAMPAMRAADRERGEHAPADRDAGQACRLRVGPDRVSRGRTGTCAGSTRRSAITTATAMATSGMPTEGRLGDV